MFCQPFFVWYFFNLKQFLRPSKFFEFSRGFFQNKTIQTLHKRYPYILIYIYIFFTYIYTWLYYNVCRFSTFGVQSFSMTSAWVSQRPPPTNSWGATGRLRPKWLGTSGGSKMEGTPHHVLLGCPVGSLDQLVITPIYPILTIDPNHWS